MKKIGVLYGVENTFPSALVDRINGMGVEGIEAESLKVGAVRMAEPLGYDVVVDRISHDMPFYRSILKNAALSGTEVINNPFWWSADDKFFNYALAQKLGVAVPKTVLLPPKSHPPQINSESLRNLEYPLQWDEIFAYVGFPAFLKPHDGGGWRDVHQVHHPDEFFWAYGQTRDLCMTLQAAVDFQEYFRCYVVGQKEVRIMAYDPRRPHEQRYIQEPPEYAPELLERVERDALTLCRALGYDLNTVEFAVENGVPYAIDFMNPAPDADFYSVGQENFNWIVDAVARLAIEKAQAGPKLRGEVRCLSLLNGTAGDAKLTQATTGTPPPPAKKVPAKKAAAKGAAVKGAPVKGAPAKGALVKKVPAKKAAVTVAEQAPAAQGGGGEG